MPVEVILKTKVEGLGAEADIVSVKPGYARNYLIPQNFAAPATSATKRQIEDLKRKRAAREAEEFNKAQELAGKLGKLKLSFTLNAGEGQEKVFGAVTSQDIATKLQENGFEIDKKKIKLPKAIKDRGDHEVEIDIYQGVVAKVNVIVEVPSAKTAEEDSENGEKPHKKKSAYKAKKEKAEKSDKAEKPAAE
jgi:large subunit ribosomal protein L9